MEGSLVRYIATHDCNRQLSDHDMLPLLQAHNQIGSLYDTPMLAILLKQYIPY